LPTGTNALSIAHFPMPSFFQAAEGKWRTIIIKENGKRMQDLLLSSYLILGGAVSPTNFDASGFEHGSLFVLGSCERHNSAHTSVLPDLSFCLRIF